MTEAKLEAVIAAQIAALDLDGAKVFTTFGTAMQDEDDASACIVTISTANRQQDTWEIPQYDFTFGIQIASRIEFGKSAHIARVEDVADLLQTWVCRGGASALKSAFTIADEFAPVYCQLNGGTNLTDTDEGKFVWEQEFTIRGIIN